MAENIDHSSADVIDIDKVAEMMTKIFECPCNSTFAEEWLPVLCDHKYTCDCLYTECWKQYIKHYDKRKEVVRNGYKGLDNQFL